MISGEIKSTDKIHLIPLEKAKAIFGEDKWVGMVQNTIGWGNEVTVKAEDDGMYSIDGTPFKFNAVCFETASEARYNRLAKLYGDKK
jgi:hypothetical protein